MAQRSRRRTPRGEELSGREKIKEKLLKLMAEVEKGFSDQQNRSDQILDNWDAYNCKLGERQQYNGNSRLYMPLIRNAVEARKTRFTNQMFPQSGRFIEVVTDEQDPPYALMALLESYIHDVRLRTQIMPALCVNGDIEGQYTLYVDWDKIERRTVSRETKPIEVNGQPHPELGEVEEIVEETIEDEGPAVEVISDLDFLVFPATADSLEKAFEKGGGCAIVRRWTEAMIRQMIDDGEFEEDAGEEIIKNMGKKDSPVRADTAKQLAEAAGIKTAGDSKYCQGFEVWTKLKVDKTHRLCRTYYGGDSIILGCKQNPFWCDRVPVLSAPVKKTAGVFKGQPLVNIVVDMQVAANDALNEGMDSLPYHLTGVTLVDPAKVQRWNELVLDTAAVWPVPPDGVKQLQFPNLAPAAFDVIEKAKSAIYEALSVNPAMLPQQSGGKNKRNQAEIAMEQQVDLLTTADSVTNIEGEILTPMVQRFAEYDHQFREKDKLVQLYGELGRRAEMEEVPPIQLNRRWRLKWMGVEAAKNAAAVQQQIAALNVIRSIPPDQYAGYQLDVAPLMVHIAEVAFGPRLGPKVFKSVKEQMTVDPQLENKMLEQGMEVLVHILDDDAKHIQVHMQAPGGPQMMAHIQRHQIAMQKKQAAAMMAQAAQQGGPPGQGGRAARGQPRPGAQPAGPRSQFGPPGGIRPDSMSRAGALVPPRRA